MEQSHMRIAEIPLFRGLDEPELIKLAELVIPRFYRKKTVVFTEGSEKEAVYIVEDGLIKAFKTDAEGHEQIVNFLGPGSLFPHTGFFLLSPYPATAEAVVDTHVLAIPLRSFERLIASTPTMAIKIMRVMSEIILELQSKIQELTGQEVQVRLRSFLTAMVDKQGEELADGSINLPLPITHQELASTIGTTRESVSRLLAQLRKEGLVESGRSGFVIHDIELLRQWGRSKEE